MMTSPRYVKSPCGSYWVLEILACPAPVEAKPTAFDAMCAILNEIQPIDDEFAITSGQSTPAAQTSKGATAPTACGLTRTAHDGERLGRMTWVPGLQLRGR